MSCHFGILWTIVELFIACALCLMVVGWDRICAWITKKVKEKCSRQEKQNRPEPLLLNFLFRESKRRRQIPLWEIYIKVFGLSQRLSLSSCLVTNLYYIFWCLDCLKSFSSFTSMSCEHQVGSSLINNWKLEYILYFRVNLDFRMSCNHWVRVTSCSIENVKLKFIIWFLVNFWVNLQFYNVM